MLHRAVHSLILAVLFITVIGCSRAAPPGPNSVVGKAGQTSYQLLDWTEGLRILIWDDIYDGEHHYHSESATGDPIFHQSGRAHAANGRGYEYSLETRDGLKADFAIDGKSYDLDRGKLFLIYTAGSQVRVEQIDLDLSALPPSNAGVEDFGQQRQEIASFVDAAAGETTSGSCSHAGDEFEPPVEISLPPDPLPSSLKGYVLQISCWEGGYYFTLAAGLNAVQPCVRQDSHSSIVVPSITVKGIEALKLAMDQLKPSEYVTLCTNEKTDAGLIEDIISHSKKLGLQLSVSAELVQDASPPAQTASTPNLAPPIDPHRMPDSTVTVSAVGPDSLWYAFDRFDDIGGSPAYGQYQGLYRLKNGSVTHLDIPAIIRSLEFSPGGDLYVGAGCGIMRNRDGLWETLLEIDCGRPSSVNSLIPLDIDFDQDDTLWVGGPYSLASFSGDSWTEFDIPAARLAAADDGSLWTRGWDGRANSDCCLTHIKGSQWVTYTMSADIPAEPELLNTLFDRP